MSGKKVRVIFSVCFFRLFVASDKPHRTADGFATASRQWPASDLPDSEKRDCPSYSEAEPAGSTHWPKQIRSEISVPTVEQDVGNRDHKNVEI